VNALKTIAEPQALELVYTQLLMDVDPGATRFYIQEVYNLDGRNLASLGHGVEVARDVLEPGFLNEDVPRTFKEDGHFSDEVWQGEEELPGEWVVCYSRRTQLFSHKFANILAGAHGLWQVASDCMSS
jgi:hypothetical protein